MENWSWFAVYTKGRSEKKVKELFERQGYTAYLPLIKVLRQWSDRKKMVEQPLIPSYVFVKATESIYYKILETPGVVRYVTFNGKAAPIPESQIFALQCAIDKNLKIEISTESIASGEQVKVINGPLKGIFGEMVGSVHKRNFLIRISHIGYSLLVEIDAADVIKTGGQEKKVMS